MCVMMFLLTAEALRRGAFFLNAYYLKIIYKPSEAIFQFWNIKVDQQSNLLFESFK